MSVFLKLCRTLAIGNTMIIPNRMLFPAAAAKCRDAFQVADDARGVINIFGAAGGAGIQGAFVDSFAMVTDSDFDINAKVVAAGMGSDIK